MKILFIGLGSVGQRHIRNIKSKFKNIKFYTLKGNSETGEIGRKHGVENFGYFGLRNGCSSKSVCRFDSGVIFGSS